jgi:hypothetical protein
MSGVCCTRERDEDCIETSAVSQKGKAGLGCATVERLNARYIRAWSYSPLIKDRGRWGDLESKEIRTMFKWKAKNVVVSRAAVSRPRMTCSFQALGHLLQSGTICFLQWLHPVAATGIHQKCTWTVGRRQLSTSVSVYSKEQVPRNRQQIKLPVSKPSTMVRVLLSNTSSLQHLGQQQSLQGRQAQLVRLGSDGLWQALTGSVGLCLLVHWCQLSADLSRDAQGVANGCSRCLNNGAWQPFSSAACWIHEAYLV